MTGSTMNTYHPEDEDGATRTILTFYGRDGLPVDREAAEHYALTKYDPDGNLVLTEEGHIAHPADTPPSFT